MDHDPEPNHPPVLYVVGAALVENGRLLATQRGASMDNPLEWELPGGKVEPGEDPRQALRREIDEELGLNIHVGALLGRGLLLHPHRSLRLDIYWVTREDGTLQLAEHRSHAWLAPDDLSALRWSAADRPLLPSLIRALRSSSDTA